MKREERGLPIGAYSSQPLGNLVVSVVDRLIKDEMGRNCMVRYCDDVTVLTRTKAEAHRQIRAYIEASEKFGLVVKADFIVAKIARYGKKKQRKRQRGARHRNRLSRVSVLQGENADEEINKETLCEKK
jgi:hypothetical protein